jgi:hypothetical protein
VTLALTVLKDHKVTKVRKVTKATKDHKVTKVRKATKATKVLKVMQVQMVFPLAI